MAIWQLGFDHYLQLINQSRLRLKSKNEMLFTSKAFSVTSVAVGLRLGF